MKSELDEHIVERLALLGEECNELAKEVCKIQRFGLTPLNQDKFIQEMGDVMAMLGVCVEALDIPMDVLKVAHDAKLEKLKQFTNY